MTQPEDDSEIVQPPQVNPAYASFQIAKALITSVEHDDPTARERAKERIAKWETVLRNILSGDVHYGRRTPVPTAPAWATLEVITGGFATGQLLAAGPLQEHEKKLLSTLAPTSEAKPRNILNSYFLTEAGLADLCDKLQSNCYDIKIPEEGALLVIAWLVKKGHPDEARALVDQLSPYFSELRFYPIPIEQPRRFGSRVHLKEVGETIQDLLKIRPNNQILAQKEAIEIWIPYYDQIIALFIETVVDGWPCQQYPNDWHHRGRMHVDRYTVLRREHTLCGRPERKKKHFSELLELLRRCVLKPKSITGRDVGKVRLILNQFVAKRGAPDSPECAEHRLRQSTAVSGPTFHDVSRVVVRRLEGHSKDEGLDDVSHLKQPVSEAEAIPLVPVQTEIPPSIRRKVDRCLNETIDVLVERDLITSGETLAKVLPQMISGLRAEGISDPDLRQLYGAIYRAFRRRRSLLLLNLEKQVRIEELPWVQAIEQFRDENLSTQEVARQTLGEITLLTIASFPFAILPNKLIQELRALAKGANIKIPLIDELAADIFMGEFSDHFVEAAKIAGQLLRGTVYAKYYSINYDQIDNIPPRSKLHDARQSWFQSDYRMRDQFAQLCAQRAGVQLGTWDPATNGMIIEQQQILTTQNLAPLFLTLEFREQLKNQFGSMARDCFKWVCNRQQMKIASFHARLIMVKNSAYAWRQMIFFLSLMPNEAVFDFLEWATDYYFTQQSPRFCDRFAPAVNGLRFVVEHGPINSDAAQTLGLRHFLGWTNITHWLLRDES